MKLGVVACACNPSIKEAKAGEYHKFETVLSICNEFQASLNYRVNALLKKGKPMFGLFKILLSLLIFLLLFFMIINYESFPWVCPRLRVLWLGMDLLQKLGYVNYLFLFLSFCFKAYLP